MHKTHKIFVGISFSTYLAFSPAAFANSVKPKTKPSVRLEINCRKTATWNHVD